MVRHNSWMLLACWCDLRPIASRAYLPRCSQHKCCSWLDIVDVVAYFPPTHHGHGPTGSNAIQRVQAIWLRANASYLLRPSVSQQRNLRAKTESHRGKQGSQDQYSKHLHEEDEKAVCTGILRGTRTESRRGDEGGGIPPVFPWWILQSWVNGCLALGQEFGS